MADGVEKARRTLQPLPPGFQMPAFAAVEPVRESARALTAGFDPARHRARPERRCNLEQRTPVDLRVAIQSMHQAFRCVVETLSPGRKELVGARQCARERHEMLSTFVQ